LEELVGPRHAVGADVPLPEAEVRHPLGLRACVGLARRALLGRLALRDVARHEGDHCVEPWLRAVRDERLEDGDVSPVARPEGHLPAPLAAREGDGEGVPRLRTRRAVHVTERPRGRADRIDAEEPPPRRVQVLERPVRRDQRDQIRRRVRDAGQAPPLFLARAPLRDVLEKDGDPIVGGEDPVLEPAAPRRIEGLDLLHLPLARS
jgi:hypothetical protein